jgi:Fe-S-cluster containining protein
MFEYTGYKRIRVKENGVCILSEQVTCRIHSVKPETCRAGPFTFDVQGDIIEIFIKYERICPLVKLLKEIPQAYQMQSNLAVKGSRTSSATSPLARLPQSAALMSRIPRRCLKFQDKKVT